MFIDTHRHISSEYYSNIDKVINDNKKANVFRSIVSFCDKKSIEEELYIIDKYESLYATIGYHPSEVSTISELDLIRLEEYISSNKKIIGIGEIGLDYHYGKDDRDSQIILFEKQLEIAERLDLPVVIHSRDAVSDTINVLNKYKVTGIIHCFSGSLEVAKTYIKMGYKLGIGGVVTFKNSKLAEVISNIELDDIVLETDSPYLAPEPFRGTTNSSKNIPIIAKRIADIKNVTIDEVEKVTTNNVISIFADIVSEK